MPASVSSSEPSNRDAWTRAWVMIWGIFLAAFMVIGACGLKPLASRVRAPSQGSRNSSDAVLLGQLGVSNASARIAACLGMVPLDRPVAVIYQNEPRTRLSALQFLTLAWPRKTPLIELPLDESLDLAKIQAQYPELQNGAFFFLGVSRPREIEGVRSLSQLLHFRPGPPPSSTQP